MTFTALHRHLGDAPGPLTDDMVDRAVAQGLRETDDLDWKSELPVPGDLNRSDFPKDVAAMANSGGGTLVFGVTESQKAATGRTDAGTLSERHERTLRSVAVTAISPPVFGLDVVQVGEPGNHCVIVVVPPSMDGPHLIYRNEYFGAPFRNDADTVWMRERQVEAMYRARFDERRRSTEVLDKLYAEAAAIRSADGPAWIVAVAHPRLPGTGIKRPTNVGARMALDQALKNARVYVGGGSRHLFDNTDMNNPRPGLRRWTSRPMVDGDGHRWRETWISIHDDGSVSLAAAAGGHRRSRTEYNDDYVVESRAVEVTIADFMGLIRESGDRLALSEYDVKIGFEWNKKDRLEIRSTDGGFGSDDRNTIPLAQFTPVEVTVRADVDVADFYQQVHDLALDCVNQAGIGQVQTISALN